MKIDEIISKYYDELHIYWTGNTIVSELNTDEDTYHNILLMALRKFKDKDITEKEGLDYLKISLCEEKFFRYKRRSKEVYITENLDEVLSLKIEDDF